MAGPDEADVRNAIEQLDRVRRHWLRRPSVGAVDVGYRIQGGRLTDVVAVRVHLERKLPEGAVPPHELFPPDLEGIPVDVIEAVYEASSSTLAPLGTATGGDPDRRSRVTPLMGGVSIGNPRVSAGTLGAIVWDRRDGSPHILSNWHVLAGSRPPCCQHGGGLSAGQPHIQDLAGLEPHIQDLAGLEPHIQDLANQSATVGEPIYQPGRGDGGTPADVVARLSRARLDCHMDAALARVVGDRPYAPHILGMGAVNGVEEHPHLGMRVRKSGRSSGVTEGIVDGVSLSTKIELNHGLHRFDDQLHIVPRAPWPSDPSGLVSEGGDSGSVWVEEETGRAVGLHFAGEREAGPEHEHALASPMWRVAEALDFTFTPHLRAAPRPAARAARTSPPTSAQIVAGAARAALTQVFLSANDMKASGGDGARTRAAVERARGILEVAQTLR